MTKRASQKPQSDVALITGFAGGLAQLVAHALNRDGFRVIGVDYRHIDAPPAFAHAVYQANYNKTKIEDIFREHHPALVFHLGRVGNLKERMGKRFDLNVIGSRKVMELSHSYRVQRLVVLSTFHIYGAHPHNPIPISEEEPLRSGTQFPQIADAIQLDSQAVTWAYRHRVPRTVILRPCNIIGPNIKNAMSSVLRHSWIPTMAGFDPMVQFIDQSDLVAALRCVGRRSEIGVFNVAGSGTVTWREAVQIIGARPAPIPSTLAQLYLRSTALIRRQLPPYLLNFIKYPCVISDQLLRHTCDWRPKVTQQQALLRVN